MFSDQLTLTSFLAGSSIVALLSLVLTGRRNREKQRLTELSSFERKPPTRAEVRRGEADPTALPIPTSIEMAIAQRLQAEEKKSKLQVRLVQAGLYQKNAARVMIILRIFAAVAPLGLGMLAGGLKLLPMAHGILLGTVVGLAGTLAPTFWLDVRKKRRQRSIRRALPDSLDVISVCLEGGMSLSAALSRVARELVTAHPLLALEMAIVERETQLGRTTGQAMREFANRFDVEELRSLASVVSQAERFGSSVTRAMQVYSDSMRLRRHQHAEEMAQKASVKIMFPTLFCIFPGIFIVVIGPAAIRIYTTLVQGFFTSVGSPL